MPHAEYGVAHAGLLPHAAHSLDRRPRFRGHRRSRDAPRWRSSTKRWRSSIGRIRARSANASTRIGQPGEWATVIGVVGHVHNAGPAVGGRAAALSAVPRRARQRTLSIVARTSAPLSSVAGPRSCRDQVDSTPSSPSSKFGRWTRSSLARWRGSGSTRCCSASSRSTALVLASVGLYGVMAFLVSQRTREIGIRMALGGEPRAIRRMVLREGILICLGRLLVGRGCVARRFADAQRTACSA